MRKPMVIGSHVFVFLVAIAVFWLGLALGLQYNPTYGTILWAAALAIVLVNLVWMLRSIRRMR